MKNIDGIIPNIKIRETHQVKLDEFGQIPIIKSKIITRTCRECGCTDSLACLGGCFWVGLDICSSCFTELQDKYKADPINKKPSVSEELIILLKTSGINSKAMVIEILTNLQEYEI